MKCDRCGVNNATNRIVLSYMGGGGEMRLCDSCVDDLRRCASGITNSFDGAPAFWGFSGIRAVNGPAVERSRVMVREPEEELLFADAGEDIKRRRSLGELKAKLRAAVESENYERAAELRDRIFREEN